MIKTIVSNKNEFNLKIFSEEFQEIYFLNCYDCQIDIVYYLDIIDINGILLGSPDKILFCLKSINCLDELTFNVYSEIYKRINTYN